MVKLERPLNEYSKANWGDHPETREGHVICIKSMSNLVSIVSKLKDKQWEKIFAVALASGRHKNMKAAAAAVSADTDSDSSQAMVELWDDDSDLNDD